MDVKIIGTTPDSSVPIGLFTQPKIDELEILRGPAYAFYIENPRANRRVIFDLGLPEGL